MKRIPVILITVCWFSSCIGQIKIIQSHNVAKTVVKGDSKIIKTQGSSQYDNVNCGIQDKSGNLWFATSREGVYRYNGQCFTNYTEKEGLSSNIVNCVLEDKTGNIWFGTKAGLCRFDGKNFRSIPIVVNNGYKFDLSSRSTATKSPLEIWTMIQDKSGNFWFGTSDSGVYRYDGKAFTHFLHDDGVINSSGLHLKWVESILEDKKGNIWFGGRGNGGVFRFDGKTLTNYKPDKEVCLMPRLVDKAGNIWFGSGSHGMCIFDGINFKRIAEKELSGWEPAVTEDKTGNIWFATESGVLRYDPSEGPEGSNAFQYIAKEDIFGKRDTWCIVADRDGSLWLGTKSTGLYHYDPSAKPDGGSKSFTDFSDTTSRDVRRIYEDKKGNMWIGTNGDGVCRYGPPAESGARRPVTYFSIKEGLAGKDVRCISEDIAGNLWFATEGGLSKFDGVRFTNFTVKDGLANNEVWSLLADKMGTIWAGTLEGVFRHTPSLAKDPNTKAFSNFPIPAATERDFSRSVTSAKVIWDIREDRAGQIWFATNGGGVYRFDPSTSFRAGSEPLINISTKDGLCSNFVNCILEDKKGNLWFATQHEGVSRYNPSNVKGGAARFTTFNYKDGIHCDEVWTMAEDKSGNIWLSAKGNFYSFDGKTFKRFAGNTEEHTTMVRNYVQSIFEDRKGILWIGCSGGLYRIDPTGSNKLINYTREWAIGIL